MVRRSAARRYGGLKPSAWWCFYKISSFASSIFFRFANLRYHNPAAGLAPNGTWMEQNMRVIGGAKVLLLRSQKYTTDQSRLCDKRVFPFRICLLE